MRMIDIYAQPLKLNLNGNYKLKTSIGGYFTIVTVIIMVFYTWFQAKELYLKKNPSIYNQKITMDQANLITFDKDSFSPFFFQIFDLNEKPFIEPSVLNIKLRTKRIIKSKIQNITIIDINTCEKKHFNKFDNSSQQGRKSYDFIIKNQYFCTELKENLNISGSYIEDDLTMIQILVYPCRNSTGNVVCKSQKEIDQIIWNKRLFLSFFYPLLSINLNDYSNPITFNLKEDYYYLPQTFNYKYFTYGVDVVLISTDGGYINKDDWEASGNSINLISNDIRNINDYDPHFFSIDILSTFYKDSFTRSYIKIFDIISICGGLFNTIRLFFLYLTNFLFDFEVTEIMMNNVFAFKDPFRAVEIENETDKHYKTTLNDIKRMDKNVEKKIYEGYLSENKSNKSKHKIESSQISSKLNHLSDQLINENNMSDVIIHSDSNITIKKINHLIAFKDKNDNDENCKHSIDSKSISLIKNKNRFQDFKVEMKNFNFENNNEKLDIINLNNKQTINNNKAKHTIKKIKDSKMNSNEKVKNKLFLKKTNKNDQLRPIPKNSKVNDFNLISEIYHKIYLAKKLKFRIKSDKLNLSVWQHFKLILCNFCFSKFKVNTYDSKLKYLINEYSKKTESYLDCIKIIKNYEETEILLKVLLDEHHINILKLMRKQNIEIPENFGELKRQKNESFENKTFKLAEDICLINSIDKLFEKYNHERNYDKNQPILKLNENFINLIHNS